MMFFGKFDLLVGPKVYILKKKKDITLSFVIFEIQYQRYYWSNVIRQNGFRDWPFWNELPVLVDTATPETATKLHAIFFPSCGWSVAGIQEWQLVHLCFCHCWLHFVNVHWVWEQQKQPVNGIQYLSLKSEKQKKQKTKMK